MKMYIGIALEGNMLSGGFVLIVRGWIDDLGNQLVDDLGNKIVFKET